MKRAIRISSFFAGSMVVASCGGSSEPPPQQPQTFVAPPANPNAPPTQPTTTPVSPTAPTASAPVATPPPAIFDAAAAAAIHLALQPRAATDAKGMKEDGAAIGGMINEGGELTQEFMLMPGKCYTILGQGLPPIAELDMTLSLKLPVPDFPRCSPLTRPRARRPASAPGKIATSTRSRSPRRSFCRSKRPRARAPWARRSTASSRRSPHLTSRANECRLRRPCVRALLLPAARAACNRATARDHARSRTTVRKPGRGTFGGGPGAAP